MFKKKKRDRNVKKIWGLYAKKRGNKVKKKKTDEDIKQQKAVSNGLCQSLVKIFLRYSLILKLTAKKRAPAVPPMMPSTMATGTP